MNTDTYIISDLHITELEQSKNPIWKKYKKPENSPEKSLVAFIRHIILTKSTGQAELVFNGDTFDFDAVMHIPEVSDKNVKVSPIEKIRGLNSEKKKSEIKMNRIIHFHKDFFDALSEWIVLGNKIIFIIGNHDSELFWQSVKEIIKNRISSGSLKKNIVFCNWFYVSNKDTLIEHGNQYDPYSVCVNPINPFVFYSGKQKVRLSFGDNASKYIINGLGLINPYSDESFNRGFKEYIKFYFEYGFKNEPFILFKYCFGGIITYVISIHEAMMSSFKKKKSNIPMFERIAKNSNAEVKDVIFLRELHSRSVVYSPIAMAKILRFDVVFSVFFVGLSIFDKIIFGNNQITLFFLGLFVLPAVGLLFSLILYGYGKSPSLQEASNEIESIARVAASIIGTKFVVLGHTHKESITKKNGITVVNTGTWAYSFSDFEEKSKFGNPCFAKISQAKGSSGREIELIKWDGIEKQTKLKVISL